MRFDSLDSDFASAPLPGESRKRAAITPAQFAALPAKQVPCGLLTLTLSDGSRKRFRIRLERGKFMTGQRTLSRYCKIESDDEREIEWESIATVGESGFLLFKRWRNQWEERWAGVIWHLLNGQEVPGYSLEVQPRCWLTMRELKDDLAKRTGLCPTWHKRLIGSS